MLPISCLVIIIGNDINWAFCWLKNKLLIAPSILINKIKSMRSVSFWPLSSVQFSRSIVFDSLRPHGLQNARFPCPSPTSEACSNSCPLSRWCHPTISSVVPFSSCPQSFPTSGSFPVSQSFTSGGQVLEFQLQHQSFQCIFRTDFL